MGSLWYHPQRRLFLLSQELPRRDGFIYSDAGGAFSPRKRSAQLFRVERGTAGSEASGTNVLLQVKDHSIFL